MTNFEKYPKSLGKQKEVKEEKIKVNRNLKLEEICSSYNKWLDSKTEDLEERYNEALPQTKQYSSEDIKTFSLELTDYQKRKNFNVTGLFLSALINTSKEKEFEIVTEILDKKIDLIGYRNTKKINVKGNAGDLVGWYNEGTVSVGGNAGNDVGDYNKGTVSVGGNAGNDVGYCNRGTVSVKGKIKSLDENASGEIYREEKE